MSMKMGDTPTTKPTSQPADLAFDLKMAKRRGQSTKDWYTHSLKIKGKRRHMAMDYVSPGDGGY